MAKTPHEKLQDEINKMLDKKDKSREKRRTEQNYEIEHINICKNLDQELIKYI